MGREVQLKGQPSNLPLLSPKNNVGKSNDWPLYQSSASREVLDKLESIPRFGPPD
jgi:hypothetical protein